MGCPDNIALKILKGDMVCVVMDDKQTIEIATYDRFLHKDFPRPNLSSWYERNHKEIGDTAREYYRALEQIARFVQKQKLEIPIKAVIADDRGGNSDAIAKYAVNCADALIKRLKEVNNG